MKNRLLDFLLRIGVVTICLSLAFLIVLYLFGFVISQPNTDVEKGLEKLRMEKNHEK